MRVSVTPGDPGYQRDTQNFQITLDGERVERCLTADEEEGFVEVLAVDDAGEIVLNATRDEFVTEIRRGVVRVTPTPTRGIPTT